MITKTSILITGGSGFIAGRLTEYFSKLESFQVTTCARNIDKISKRFSNVQYLNIDWDSTSNLEQLCHEQQIVIHTAGANAGDCAKDPELAKKINGDYTEKLINASIKKSVKRFIYFSTIHTYSGKLAGLIDENFPTTNEHPYATTHLLGENHLKTANDKNLLEGIRIRLSNSFGAPLLKENNCWMLLINDLCRQAVATGKINIRSPRNISRDFVPLSYVCEATSHLTTLSSDKIGDGLFNIGSSETLTIKDVTKLIASAYQKIFNEELTVEFETEELASIKGEKLKYSIEKLINSGFRELSDYEFEDEVIRLLNFCKENL